jgi:hypothetical protein
VSKSYWWITFTLPKMEPTRVNPFKQKTVLILTEGVELLESDLDFIRARYGGDITFNEFKEWGLIITNK